MEHCIFCKEVGGETIEHVVPESLGNTEYIMPPGTICADCNNMFSAFEKNAVSKSIFLFERGRMGVPTKKGTAASGEVDGIKITGDPGQKKGFISVGGVKEFQVEKFNPVTGETTITIQTFDQTYNPTAKLLLKMGLESLYKSRK